MSNTFFQFQQFRIDQAQSGMKVTTDACLFGGWVAHHLKNQMLDPTHILDIGAGTGLLSLMLAQATTTSQITAIESNEQAYRESTLNFESSPWKSRLSVEHRALQDFNPEITYDVIICNPPFFQNSHLGRNENKNEALHNDNLSQKELLKGVEPLLSDRGMFYLLYPQREMKVFQLFAQNSDLLPHEQLMVRNKEGASAFRVMASFSKRTLNEKHTEIIIRKEDGKYTDEFWSLLKDYYLPYNDPNA